MIVFSNVADQGVLRLDPDPVFFMNPDSDQLHPYPHLYIALFLLSTTVFDSISRIHRIGIKSGILYLFCVVGLLYYIKSFVQYIISDALYSLKIHYKYQYGVALKTRISY